MVILRTAKAAKIAARAGRISRVVKVLKFLPFLNLKETDGSQMAKVISARLTNVLATRVAGLTILLSVVLPLMLTFTYPGQDLSLSTTPTSLYGRFEDTILDANTVAQPGSTMRTLYHTFLSNRVKYRDIAR